MLAVTLGVLALAVRVLLVVRAGGLAGIDGYDGGVYYAAATSLLWGRVPYAHFLLLHPPGIMLLLMPFAVLGRLTADSVGFEAARGVSLLVGAVDAALLVVVARRGGLGRAGAVTAGVLYALWTPAVMAETTIRLEPWVTLALLGALVALLTPGRRPTRAHLVVAGCCLALAVSVKIWAAAPAVFLLLWCWRRWGPRVLAPVLLGGTLAALLVDLPFFVAAPGEMWRMVVLDQLGRGRTSVSGPQRLLTTLLDGRPVDVSSPAGHLAAGGVAVVLCLAAVAAVRTPVGRFALGLLGVQLAVLALSPSFYSYYPAYAAPTVALLLGAAVGQVAHRVCQGRSWGPARHRSRPVTARLVLVGVGAILATAAVVDTRVTIRMPFPATAVAADAAGARCVTSDSPDALMLTNLYSRDLARGCRAPVDLSGLSYDVFAPPRLSLEQPVSSRAYNVRWQHHLVGYLRGGQMIFIMRAADDGVSPLLRHRVLQLPKVAAGRGYRLYDNAGRQVRASGPRVTPARL